MDGFSTGRHFRSHGSRSGISVGLGVLTDGEGLGDMFGWEDRARKAPVSVIEHDGWWRERIVDNLRHAWVVRVLHACRSEAIMWCVGGS